MLELKEVSKSFGGKVILSNISFTVDHGEKAGIIGSNGVGKSTLLKIIARQLHQDSGEINTNTLESIGYLKQEFEIPEESLSVTSFIKWYIGIDKLEKRLNELQEELEKNESNIEEFCAVQEKYIRLDGYNFDYKLDNILNGLGILPVVRNKKIKDLSGGQKSKIILAAVLLKGADLLLLDEPTNNLDIKSIEWLEGYLKSVNMPCLIVSHDRRFLNAVTTKTLEINFFDRTLSSYPGNYAQYREFKEAKEKRQLELYEAQQEKKKELQDSIRQKKDWASKGRKQGVKDNDKYTRGYERDRSSGLASKARKIEKQIEKLDKIERPRVKKKLKININFSKIKGSTMIYAKELICGYPNGFKTSPITFEVKFGEKVIIVGKNGSGKSTFIKTLFSNLEKISGTMDIGTGLNIGYISQDTKIDTDQDLEQFIIGSIDEEKLEDKSKVYTTLAQFNFTYEERQKKYAMLSPGERTRARLVIFSLLDINVLVFDEPTNHLDIEALEALEEVISSFDGTVIAISHDREFIGRVHPDKIYKMDNGNLTKI
jgi:ATP-binding cassette subfamily F protein 3